MTKQSVASKWLFFYERREGSGLLWVSFAGCALATLCVFGGFSAVQWAIERTEEFRNIAPHQTSATLVGSNYSVTQLLVFAIQGVKYQLCIALVLIIRWLSLFAYRCCDLSTRRKWLTILIAEGSLILAIATFVRYGWLSYRVYVTEIICKECIPPTLVLLGSTQLWAALLGFVMLVQTIYGLVRLVVPTIDMVRAKDATPRP